MSGPWYICFVLGESEVGVDMLFSAGYPGVLDSLVEGLGFE